MFDAYGREIDYVRISLTDNCNIRCIYCMPEKGTIENYGERLSYEDIIKIIRVLGGLGIKKVRFTGGEPLIFKDIDRLIYDTSRIEGIQDIAITTNGILLEEKIEALKKAGLKRLNINIPSLDKDNYCKITRGGDLHKVLRGLQSAIDYGFNPIKLNTVLIKGINDKDVDTFINMAAKMPVEVRFIELMPIGEGKYYYDNGGRMACEEIIKSHKELIPLKDVKTGNARMFSIPGGAGKVGFIEPVSCKFCDSCSKIRLTSYGIIKPCLHSMEEIDIKEYLEDDEKLKEALKKSILLKSKEHYLDKDNISRSAKQMFQIGG